MPPLGYRPKEAAAALGVSRSTIYEMIANGQLEARKIGAATIIRHVDLAALLDAAVLSDATKLARASAR